MPRPSSVGAVLGVLLLPGFAEARSLAVVPGRSAAALQRRDGAALAPEPRSPGLALAAAGAAARAVPPRPRRGCPEVKMTSRLINLRPDYSNFWGQHGTWQASSDDLMMGYWSQTFFAEAWQNVALDDQDGQSAVHIQATTRDDLLLRYGWEAGAPPSSYANLSSLQAEWERAMYRTALKAQTLPQDPSKARILQLVGPANTSKTYAMLDCHDNLLFVAFLQDSTRSFPGAMDIYDSNGALAAHTLTNSRIARHLFVDPQGYLLATAEAPRLNDSIPYRSMPKDPARGGVLAYQLKIERGGYANASRLLDQENLWVLAAVTQLRAIQDGRSQFAPILPQVLPWAYWLVAAALALVVLVVCVVLNRIPALPKHVEAPWPHRASSPAPPEPWRTRP